MPTASSQRTHWHGVDFDSVKHGSFRDGRRSLRFRTTAPKMLASVATQCGVVDANDAVEKQEGDEEAFAHRL